MNAQHRISSVEELESVIGAPMEFVRAKIRTVLDQPMKDFVARAPLIFVSTIDEQGHPDISPKGDPPGFVKVDEAGALLIPERLGNRLTFGFRNILKNGQIGIIFVVPNQRETLRVKGVATLHNEPTLLDDMQVDGKPALMYTRVEIKECLFHCGKAMIRSHMWRPEFWNADTRSLGARQFAFSIFKSDTDDAMRDAEELIEKSYKDDLY